MGTFIGHQREPARGFHGESGRGSFETLRPREPDELGRLLDHVASDPLGAFYKAVAATGRRRGEALALRWENVDLDPAVLVVRRQLLQVGGVHPFEYCQAGHRGMARRQPKTASGEDRLVELDSHTIGVLLEQQLLQDTDREKWGDTYPEHGLEFAHEDGTTLCVDEVNQRFGVLFAAAGVAGCTCTTCGTVRRACGWQPGADIALVSNRWALVDRHHRRHVLARALRGRPTWQRGCARWSLGLPGRLAGSRRAPRPRRRPTRRSRMGEPAGQRH